MLDACGDDDVSGAPRSPSQSLESHPATGMNHLVWWASSYEGMARDFVNEVIVRASEEIGATGDCESSDEFAWTYSGSATDDDQNGLDDSGTTAAFAVVFVEDVIRSALLSVALHDYETSSYQPPPPLEGALYAPLRERALATPQEQPPSTLASKCYLRPCICVDLRINYDENDDDDDACCDALSISATTTTTTEEMKEEPDEQQCCSCSPAESSEGGEEGDWLAILESVRDTGSDTEALRSWSQVRVCVGSCHLVHAAQLILYRSCPIWGAMPGLTLC